MEERASSGAVIVALILFVVMGLLVLGSLPELGRGVERGGRLMQGGAVPVAAQNSAAPVYLPKASAPAPVQADSTTCTNGKTPAGLDCGVESVSEGGDGQVHIYPPATDQAPCLRADGAVQLVYVDASGATQTVRGARQWDAQRSMWAVAWPQGVAYFLSLPACPGEVR